MTKKVNEQARIKKRKYNHQYDKDNCKTLLLRFNKKTASDVLAWLETKESKQGYIIDLIRKDIIANKK